MLDDICYKHAPYNSLKIREFAPPWINTEFFAAVDSTLDSHELWSRKFNKAPTEYFLGKKLEAIAFCKSLKNEHILMKKSHPKDMTPNVCV